MPPKGAAVESGFFTHWILPQLGSAPVVSGSNVSFEGVFFPVLPPPHILNSRGLMFSLDVNDKLNNEVEKIKAKFGIEEFIRLEKFAIRKEEGVYVR